MQEFGQPDVGNSYWPKTQEKDIPHVVCGCLLTVCCWRFARLVVGAVGGLHGWRFVRWAVCGWRFGRLAVWGLAVRGWRFGGWAFRRLAVWAGSGLGGWRFAWLADWAVGGLMMGALRLAFGGMRLAGLRFAFGGLRLAVCVCRFELSVCVCRFAFVGLCLSV